MPTHKVKGGYQWGEHGKVYPTKKQADKIDMTFLK